MSPGFEIFFSFFIIFSYKCIGPLSVLPYGCVARTFGDRRLDMKCDFITSYFQSSPFLLSDSLMRANAYYWWKCSLFSLIDLLFFLLFHCCIQWTLFYTPKHFNGCVLSHHCTFAQSSLFIYRFDIFTFVFSDLYQSLFEFVENTYRKTCNISKCV